MKFYDTTNRAGIVDDVWFLLFGDSADHSVDYPLADIARNVNRWYDKVVIKILQADHRWEWDDTNKTNLPISNISLVANQQDYGVSAATYLKIHKVDVKDSAGNSVNLTPINLDQLEGIADANFQSTAGTPRFYRVGGSSLFLYPKPNYAYTNGLRIFYQRNVDYFTAVDITKVPGFAEMFHRILSLGATYDYALVTGMQDKVAISRQEIKVLMDDLDDFYANRNNTRITATILRTDYGQAALDQGTGFSVNPDGFNIL